MAWIDLGAAWDPHPEPVPIPTKADACKGCGNPKVHAKGYCDRCYQRVKKGLPVTGALFTCQGCGATYSLGKARTREFCASCQSKRTRKKAPQPFCEYSLG
jgi:hypothetical protein